MTENSPAAPVLKDHGGRRDFVFKPRDYRLTTAEILYHMPDHPDLLQTYLWQDLDLAPRFPVLTRFLDFWAQNLDGRLHTVRVASTAVVKPTVLRYADCMVHVH